MKFPPIKLEELLEGVCVCVGGGSVISCQTMGVNIFLIPQSNKENKYFKF